MTGFLTAHETMVRLVAFLGVLTLVGLAEYLAPRRPRRQTRRQRWTINLAMVALGALAIRLFVPLIAVETALRAGAAGFGMFNRPGWPVWIVVPAAVVLLDFAIYAQHVAFHKIPLLWRLHRMHHSDLELDVSSGVRFHPLEYVLSMLIKVAVVALLGAPVAAVILFEVLLNATAMFNHGNLRLPAGLDRLLRRVLVTPDFHIVHHSVVHEEHDSNYGFNLTWWDYLFRTYRARAAKGPVELDIGLADWREPAGLSFVDLLAMPFRKRMGVS